MIENDVKLKLIDEKNLNLLIKLQNETIQELENDDLYRFTSFEKYMEILNKQSLVIGLFLKQELIAFGTLLRPNCFEEELLNSKIFNNIDKNTIYYYKAVVVKKTYRGKKLQIFFNEYFEDFVRKNGGIYIVLNVHPDNQYSIKNFEASGFIHYLDLVMENRYPRKAYYKKILP
ncbi:MAG: GNAT family N-acetyltransferase [Acholeplasmataceae bacterium]|nr:GNAT family N-acetyltransferase [Acholeplasmataceae bacterium]